MRNYFISLAVKPRGLALSGTAAQGKAAIRIFTQYIAHCHGVLELLVLVCCVLPLASTLTQQQENDFPIVNRVFNVVRKVGLHWNNEEQRSARENDSICFAAGHCRLAVGIPVL